MANDGPPKWMLVLLSLHESRAVKKVSPLIVILLAMVLAGCGGGRGVRCSVFSQGFPLCGI
ncbi:hypothetical protein [Mesorhizobium sp. CN2-181]|uniref:hypothetical protein n=1 Tax=Mesorhizobium yinganensis TaxID=3157707 RepID=UPI0032B7D3C8